MQKRTTTWPLVVHAGPKGVVLGPTPRVLARTRLGRLRGSPCHLLRGMKKAALLRTIQIHAEISVGTTLASLESHLILPARAICSPTDGLPFVGVAITRGDICLTSWSSSLGIVSTRRGVVVDEIVPRGETAKGDHVICTIATMLVLDVRNQLVLVARDRRSKVRDHTIHFLHRQLADRDDQQIAAIVETEIVDREQK